MSRRTASGSPWVIATTRRSSSPAPSRSVVAFRSASSTWSRSMRSPNDLDEPGCGVRRSGTARRALAPEVAGAQLGRRSAEGEIGRRLGVAEHHVRAGVDELTDARGRPARPARSGTGSRRRAAGDRRRRRCRVRPGQVRRQVGHPGGGLGLPVHDDQVPAPRRPSRRSAGPVRRQPPAGLGDVAQGGRSHPANPTRSSSSKVCGTPARRWPGGAGPVPEAGVGDRGSVSSSAPRQQVAVQHRQAVAVVQRQRGRRAVGRAMSR